jgi:hypothetical protein
MFSPFSSHVKALRPSLRAVTSPYYRPANASDPNNHQMTPSQWAAFWKQILTNAPGFDTSNALASPGHFSLLTLLPSYPHSSPARQSRLRMGSAPGATTSPPSARTSARWPT